MLDLKRPRREIACVSPTLAVRYSRPRSGLSAPTREKLGSDNAIVRSLTLIGGGPDDGRTRYSHALRAELYTFLRDEIHRHKPELTAALCMESQAIAQEVGVAGNIGKCNCIL